MHILSKSGRRGSAMVEFVLTFPMLFFALLGAVDMGFYCYALIAVQDAARTVALAASSSSGTANACSLLLANLSSMPNLSGVTTCSKLPLTLAVTSLSSGPDGQAAVQVTVSYQTIQLIPLAELPGQLTITRTVTARSRS